MAPPPLPSTTIVPPFVSLIVRVATLIFLLISLIVIATNTHTTSLNFINIKTKSTNFYAYRYLISSVVIGMAYTLLQTAFSIFFVTTGNRLGGEGLCLLDFYGDKFISYFLATGAAASFGMTEELRRLTNSDMDKFLNTSNAAASLCLFGFFFSAASSIFSSYNLPKRA
ncbi:CASP-like protein PIMP1 [Solanum lycopersicum]|uniref:CASP-like protein PIMP1 n=1 Tax=Solanum lycopersicum TaxID=4081 RepID=UPI0002765FE4|nr:CASP-like protein PIMP1 [Solanum lycopersicum]